MKRTASSGTLRTIFKKNDGTTQRHQFRPPTAFSSRPRVCARGDKHKLERD